MTGRIKLDATPETVVATCTDCTDWRAFGFTRDQVRAAGRTHEQQVHRGAEGLGLLAAIAADAERMRRVNEAKALTHRRRAR